MMHRVEVTVSAVRAGRTVSDRELVVTGEDLDTGDLITFTADRLVLEEFLKRYEADPEANPLGKLEVGVADEDVIGIVDAGPVSGEWDSPGTSPED
jgi:hypothetical protein